MADVSATDQRAIAGFQAAALAAAAMVATLPGRTHGLGLVTEPLMAELGIDRVPFAALNFWATLVGAGFCLPVGYVIDRIGSRRTLGGVLALLGLTVMLMARVSGRDAVLVLPSPEAIAGGGTTAVAVPATLFLLVLLTRGFGQSSLSVVSLAIIGKAAGDRPGRLMGIYSFMVALGFMAAFLTIKMAFERWDADWRGIWAAIGASLLGFAAVSPFLAERCGADDGPTVPRPAATGATLRQALATPAFWVFGVGTSFYGLVAAGLSLFNQSLLAERGFDRSVFLSITSLAPLIGLMANLTGGWAAGCVPLGRVAAAGLTLQAIALGCFPAIDSVGGVYVYAAAMAFAGGLLTVVFFSFWRQAYGAAHLGAIQGTAQLLTVLASAAGPIFLAVGQRAYGSYVPVVQQLAAISAIFALAALLVPTPIPAPLQGEVAP